MKRIVILGGGTAGTMMANKLVRALPEREWRVTLVDRDDVHVYQPGLLMLPFGTLREDELELPSVREMLQILEESGAALYACELAMKMFKRQKEDLVPQVRDVITAGDFYDLSEGAQIIFT